MNKQQVKSLETQTCNFPHIIPVLWRPSRSVSGVIALTAAALSYKCRKGLDKSITILASLKS